MRNYENIEYFVNQLEEGKMFYESGNLYRNDRLIKGSKAGKGKYLRIDSTVKGKKVSALIHLIVFAHFNGIEELKNHETIDHIDGDKYNNRITNLEGMTRFENSQKDSNGKLTVEEAKVIKLRLSSGETCSSLAKEFGVSVTTISKIKRGLRFKTA